MDRPSTSSPVQQQKDEEIKANRYSTTVGELFLNLYLLMGIKLFIIECAVSMSIG